MASSIKVLLRNKPNKEGLFPLVIRITKDRKSTYLYIGYYLNKKYWDAKNRTVRKSYPNSTRLNNLIASKLAEANKTLLNLEAEDKVVSSKNVKKEITNPLSKKSFNEISRDFLKELEDNNKLTRLSSNKPLVNHVIEFANTESLKFHEIDEAFLRKFMTFLKIKKGNSQRSIINALILIRTLYNRAIKMGIVDRKYYPFGTGKIRIKLPETEKIGLSIEEVRAMETLENLTPQEEHARNIWFFSFYLAGMRVADVLHIRWSDIYDGRLHYRMNKNDKLLSLKLPAKILPILKIYKADKEHKNDFIFPELKLTNLKDPKAVLAKTKTSNKKFNKYLAEIAEKANINKKLSMHISRHTFAHIAGDSIPIPTLQRLFRHTSISTTVNYMSQFIHKDFDDALDSVVNY